MMKWVFGALIIVSVVVGFINGGASEVSNAALSSCGDAVTLCITLCGVICLWSGIMRVAEKSGLVRAIAAAMSPLLKRLFRGISPSGKAMQYIVLNLTANMLGLGNASTPFGITAMRELEKEEKTDAVASDNMILFVVMNTASLQIIPTTVAALRLKNGSQSPMEILPCVWAVSLACVILAVSAAKILSRIFPYRTKGAML